VAPLSASIPDRYPSALTKSSTIGHVSGSDPRDRREHPRADVEATAVVLVRHNAGVTMTIESLSVGGARIIGELTVDRGDRVQILFDIAGRPVEVFGEVVRVDKRDIATDRVSVRFVDVAVETRDLIRELVREVIERVADQIEDE
jgi:hypothetical protein